MTALIRRPHTIPAPVLKSARIAYIRYRTHTANARRCAIGPDRNPEWTRAYADLAREAKATYLACIRDAMTPDAIGTQLSAVA